jgi:L-fuculose-phosphate aldolase
MTQDFENGTPHPDVSRQSEWDRLFCSPEAEGIKAEILEVGRKMWLRQYVDGNGGNISFRISENAVICTPTQICKGDMTAADLCLVDMDGNQLAGAKTRTSEILMHLEIYKATPEAKGVVHCHPPHATAYAITRRVPPPCIIPEYEMIVGRMALAPYQTPGTREFAETVVPYAKTHNTILLANHGIVAWADTVTHAHWCVEVADTYCWTLMLAAGLGAPIAQIGPEKAPALWAIRQKLGLPQSNGHGACKHCGGPDPLETIAVQPSSCGNEAAAPGEFDLERVVRTVTQTVLAEMAQAGKK